MPTASPEEVKRFIPYAGPEAIVMRALRSLAIEGNLRLIGEAGAGKSTLVHTLRAAADKAEDAHDDIRSAYPLVPWEDLNGKPWDLYEMSLTADTSRWDLIATQTLEKGSTDISLGPLARWLDDQTPARRKVLFLDEWNYANPGVTSTMNQLADFRRSVNVSELAILDKKLGKKDPERWGVRFRTDDHWLIVAENPYDPVSYSGTNPPNVAQLSRYAPVNIPYLETSAEIDLLVKYSGIKKLDAARIVQWATATRQRFRARELKMTITPRNTLFLARLYVDSATGKQSGWDPVIEAFKDYFPEEDRAMVTDILTKGAP